MINPAALDSLPTVAQTTLTRVKYMGKVGGAFRAAIERLYSAHIERAQMRLAPHPEHFTNTDLPPRSLSPTRRGTHVQ
jgi:hypothetical protein